MLKKKIGLTQRVIENKEYTDFYDALDQRWYDLLQKFNYLPIPLPNLKPENAEDLLGSLKLDGIILTGGETILDYPEQIFKDTFVDPFQKRDYFEFKVIDNFIKSKKPVLGVCRGMQLLNIFFGGSLSKISQHDKGVKHKIYFQDNNKFPRDIVNSYHNYGITPSDLANDLLEIAIDENKNIESFKHKELPIYGIMWHPERDNKQDTYYDFFKSIFNHD